MASGHVDKTKPLRALSDSAWGALESTCRGQVASHLYNAGIWDRLFREGLIEQTSIRGSSRIYTATDAGRAKLAARP